MTELPLVDSSLVVHIFSPGDDLIACLNKAMAFLTAVAFSRFTVQQLQRRQGQSYSGIGYKSNDTSSGVNIRKRQRNAAWYKDKAMLAEAQEARQILDEEQLAFLADPGVPDGQAAQKIIPNNVAF
nr:hypothetical protein [Tanacetum cinerariifolium]